MAHIRSYLFLIIFDNCYKRLLERPLTHLPGFGPDLDGAAVLLAAMFGRVPPACPLRAAVPVLFLLDDVCNLCVLVHWALQVRRVVV